MTWSLVKIPKMKFFKINTLSKCWCKAYVSTFRKIKLYLYFLLAHNSTPNVLWDNGLCPVLFFIKCWLFSSQATGQKCRWSDRDQDGSRGMARRIRGREKFQSAAITHMLRKQDVTVSLNKVPSHVTNIGKNNGLI